MTQFFSGQHGRLEIKSADDTGAFDAVGNLKNWSINFTMPVLETTSLGDTDRTVLHGVRSFSGSSSLLYYSSSTSNLNLMTKDFIFGKSRGSENYGGKNFGVNNEPELSRLVLRLTNGGTNYDMNVFAYITGFTISCNVGEVVQAEITFEGHGAPQSMAMIT